MKKKKIFAVIAANKSGFSIYCESLPGITGYGETIEDAKRSIKDNIAIVLNRHAIKRTAPPLALNNGYLSWIYKYDIESIFNHFPAIDSTAFIRNIKFYPTLLYQKRTGVTLATEKQVKRIASSLHELGRELLRIQV